MVPGYIEQMIGVMKHFPQQGYILNRSDRTSWVRKSRVCGQVKKSILHVLDDVTCSRDMVFYENNPIVC